jgi:hypothetical protein
MLMVPCITSSIGESTGGWFFSGDWGRENFFGRLKKDRSAVSRAAQRVGNDPELMMAATTIMEQLKSKVKQR